MTLSNAEYDEIMRGYEDRQLKNRRVSEERVQDAYQRDIRLKKIDDSIASYAVAAAQKLLNGDPNALAQMRKDFAAKESEREQILLNLGYETDFFKPLYTCPDCKDTGYVNGKRCHCLQQAIIDKVYTQSNIKNVLEKENFDNLSYAYYSNEEVSGAPAGVTELTNMKNAVAECHKFIDDFDNKPKNLLFLGNTGVGKTFLSNCVAKALLDKGKSVLYFSAFQLFDVLGKGYFAKDADAVEAHKNIFDCDLLIIDDLGTELPNAFTVSQLFLCINERILRGKSTIISTNLSISLLAETYSERTISRISANYTMLKLVGKDIRVQKRNLQLA